MTSQLVRRGWLGSRTIAGAAVFSALVAACAVPLGTSANTPGANTAGVRVLTVGDYRGHHGQFRTIQSAVDAANAGDWVLVGPGDYHENHDHSHAQLEHGGFGGVFVNKPGIHIRGMDRNGVIVDGTLPGAASACSSDPAAQDLGPVDANGNHAGRNGIVVFKADNVSVENLTACNFLSSGSDSGNGIWWNGGADTGKIGLRGYTGRYLTATSSYYGSGKVAASYGIFSSDARGRGLWDQVYASNFSDSGLYVGACKQECDMTIDHAWLQYSALGYSGTNSGGSILIQNSEFDHNKDGFDTNTQIAGDPPAPQNGACLHGAINPITRTHSCWVFIHNRVHDNNNPNVPQQGSASAGPLGTGMTISGGRNDTVMYNTFENNGAWGVLFVPFPDSGTPDPGQTCEGVGGAQVAGFGCVIDTEGTALLHNTFRNNGFFGNPTNGDFAELSLLAGRPSNCYRDNTMPDGTTPADLQTTTRTCGVPTTAPDVDANLLEQVLCDTGFGSCPAGANYPPTTGVVMPPLPKHLATMPNPCEGVPATSWCGTNRKA